MNPSRRTEASFPAKHLVDSFDFDMSPDPDALKGDVPKDSRRRRRSNPGYAVYMRTKRIGSTGSPVRDTSKREPAQVQANLVIELPPGPYHATWFNRRTGQVDRAEFRHDGGNKTLTSPAFVENIALRITAVR